MAATIDQPGTDTAVVVDVDLDAVPTCEMGEDCVGDLGPAAARLVIRHRCDHAEQVLVCAPCAEKAFRLMPFPVDLLCPRCADLHACLLFVHARLLEL